MILHLTLKKIWFDQIARGKKVVEFRERKPYWDRRLQGRTFDEVHFRNGYRPDSPFMRVQCLGISQCPLLYRIMLGEILEIKNWEETK